MQLESKLGITHLLPSTKIWIKKNAQVYNKNFVSLPLLLTLSFVINATSLALPIVLMQLFDRIIPNKNTETAIILLAGLAIFMLVESGLKYLRYYVITFAGARYENKNSQNIIERIITDQKFYNIGVFQYTLKEVASNKALLGGQGILTLTEIPFIAIFLGALIYISPPIALLPVVSLLLYFVISAVILKKIGMAIRLKHISDIRKDNLLFKILNNLIIIRKFGRNGLFTNRFKKAQSLANKYNYDLQGYEHFQLNLSKFLSQATIVITLTLGIYLIKNQKIGLGALVASVILVGRCLSPTYKIFEFFKKVHEVKIMEDIQIPPHKAQEINHIRNLDEVFSLVIPLYTNKKFKEVPFMKGDTVSLAEVSDKVKHFLFSTQVNRMRRKIIVNDFRLSDVDELSLYKKIAILNSRPNIWNGTIRDNITSFGLISEENARFYIETLGLGDIVRKLPQGLNTYITTDISGDLSEEARTLIYITRKLALDPEIVILNDFEANIDHESYVKIYHYIAEIRESKIIFINSKDHNLLNLCNRDLENNRIGEVERHLS